MRKLAQHLRTILTNEVITPADTTVENFLRELRAAKETSYDNTLLRAINVRIAQDQINLSTELISILDKVELQNDDPDIVMPQAEYDKIVKFVTQISTGEISLIDMYKALNGDIIISDDDLVIITEYVGKMENMLTTNVADNLRTIAFFNATDTLDVFLADSEGVSPYIINFSDIIQNAYAEVLNGLSGYSDQAQHPMIDDIKLKLAKASESDLSIVKSAIQNYIPSLKGGVVINSAVIAGKAFLDRISNRKLDEQVVSFTMSDSEEQTYTPMLASQTLLTVCGQAIIAKVDVLTDAIVTGVTSLVDFFAQTVRSGLNRLVKWFQSLEESINFLASLNDEQRVFAIDKNSLQVMNVPIFRSDINSLQIIADTLDNQTFRDNYLDLTVPTNVTFKSFVTPWLVNIFDEDAGFGNKPAFYNNGVGIPSTSRLQDWSALLSPASIRRQLIAKSPILADLSDFFIYINEAASLIEYHFVNLDNVTPYAENQWTMSVAIFPKLVNPSYTYTRKIATKPLEVDFYGEFKFDSYYRDRTITTTIQRNFESILVGAQLDEYVRKVSASFWQSLLDDQLYNRYEPDYQSFIRVDNEVENHQVEYVSGRPMITTIVPSVRRFDLQWSDLQSWGLFGLSAEYVGLNPVSLFYHRFSVSDYYDETQQTLITTYRESYLAGPDAIQPAYTSWGEPIGTDGMLLSADQLITLYVKQANAYWTNVTNINFNFDQINPYYPELVMQTRTGEIWNEFDVDRVLPKILMAYYMFKNTINLRSSDDWFYSVGPMDKAFRIASNEEALNYVFDKAKPIKRLIVIAAISAGILLLGSSLLVAAKKIPAMYTKYLTRKRNRLNSQRFSEITDNTAAIASDVSNMNTAMAIKFLETNEKLDNLPNLLVEDTNY